MSFPKVLAFTIFCLFAAIAMAGWWKQGRALSTPAEMGARAPVLAFTPAGSPHIAEEPSTPPSPLPAAVDRVEELFRTQGSHLPIVETITYKSHVPWLKGRQAWLSDYASHYHTSRHFLARSLNGKDDYFKQEVTEGSHFNVLRPDLRLQFNLVIDTTSCKLWLYYYDLDHNERGLIKSYTVGLGRPDSSSSSGLLTPLGAYTLGDKVAIFKPTTTGLHQGQKTQLIRVFGTRWIPFDEAIGTTTSSPKGYGIHGVPWRDNGVGELIEDTSSLGDYASDGCIRLSTADVEEIFAIVITKPTVVELVREFRDALFPVVATD